MSVTISDNVSCHAKVAIIYPSLPPLRTVVTVFLTAVVVRRDDGVRDSIRLAFFVDGGIARIVDAE